MKRIIRLTAAVLTLMMAVGCTSGKNGGNEAAQSVVNEDKIYSDLLQNTLIPEYGLMTTGQVGSMAEPTVEWLEPKGIASAYAEDLDGNGTKDMLVFYFVKDENGGIHADMAETYVMMVKAYTIENGEAKQTDEEKIYCYNDVKAMPVYLYTNNHLHDDFYATAVNANGSKYIVCEYSTRSTIFSDGNYEGYWALEYKNGQLNIAFSLSKDGPGSAGAEYKGYKFKDGAATESELLYCDIPNTGTGKYSGLDLAVEGFLGEYGIQCKYGSTGEESILVDSYSTRDIFDFSIEPSSIMSSPTASVVDLEFNLDDNSNILNRD